MRHTLAIDTRDVTPSDARYGVSLGAMRAAMLAAEAAGAGDDATVHVDEGDGLRARVAIAWDAEADA